MEMNPATLLWLPDDLAHLIIEHVDGFDLARLSQTCGRCLAAHADEQAWESVVRARWFDRRWLGQNAFIGFHNLGQNLFRLSQIITIANTNQYHFTRIFQFEITIPYFCST